MPRNCIGLSHDDFLLVVETLDGAQGNVAVTGLETVQHEGAVLAAILSRLLRAVQDTTKSALWAKGVTWRCGSYKLRGKLMLAKDASEDVALSAARELDGVQKQLEGKTLRKVIWVPGRILNLIVG